MANNNWNNYTEKTATPVDADEVMVRDSTDGKNKKLLFGTFWKWVAKKLNEATISELQTSNKTIVGALNQLNSEKVYAYTPSFSWSDGTVNPTVENITAYVTLYGKVCFIYARYNITNLGSFNSNSYLRISLPNGISSIVSSTCLVSPYQITGAVSKLGTRITGDYVLIVDEVGGNYSAKSIPKGYQGFSVFFIIK